MPFPSNASPINRIPRLLLTVGLGALVGSQLSGILADNSPWSIAGLLVGIFLGAQLQVLVHELGHALAGRASGLRLIFMVAGKLAYEPGSGLNVGWSHLLTFGATGLVPTLEMTLPQIVRAMRTSVTAGPLVGLLFSGACWLGFLTAPTGGWKSFLWATALVGIYLHVISLLFGVTRQGLVTDGGQLLLLRPGAEIAEARAAVPALLARMEVQRPRDWPITLVEAARRSQGEPSAELGALQFTINYALDTADLGGAERLPEQARTLNAERPEARRSSFWVEETYLLARQGHADAAREAFDAGVPDPDLSPVTRLRVQTAVLIAEGHPEEAMKTIEAARIQSVVQMSLIQSSSCDIWSSGQTSAWILPCRLT